MWGWGSRWGSGCGWVCDYCVTNRHCVMRSGEGCSWGMSLGLCRGQAAWFLVAGANPTPKLLLLQLQSSLLYQSPASISQLVLLGATQTGGRRMQGEREGEGLSEGCCQVLGRGKGREEMYPQQLGHELKLGSCIAASLLLAVCTLPVVCRTRARLTFGLRKLEADFKRGYARVGGEGEEGRRGLT